MSILKKPEKSINMTELKWTLAAIVLIMFCFTFGKMHDNKMKMQCKVAALAMNKTPADIAILCK